MKHSLLLPLRHGGWRQNGHGSRDVLPDDKNEIENGFKNLHSVGTHDILQSRHWSLEPACLLTEITGANSVLPVVEQAPPRVLCKSVEDWPGNRNEME